MNINQLPRSTDVNETDIFPVSQDGITKAVSMGQVKEFCSDGGNNNLFIVNVEYTQISATSATVNSVDKTPEEVKAAYDSNSIIIARAYPEEYPNEPHILQLATAKFNSDDVILMFNFNGFMRAGSQSGQGITITSFNMVAYDDGDTEYGLSFFNLFLPN